MCTYSTLGDVNVQGTRDELLREINFNLARGVLVAAARKTILNTNLFG